MFHLFLRHQVPIILVTRFPNLISDSPNSLRPLLGEFYADKHEKVSVSKGFCLGLTGK